MLEFKRRQTGKMKQSKPLRAGMATQNNTNNYLTVAIFESVKGAAI